jgi:hypothetical protein
MIVGERVPAQHMQLALAAVVAAEDEQGRGGAQPVLAHDGIEPLAHGGILDNHDVALLEVALGRRGERNRA